MNKLFQNLHDFLPDWASDWLDILVPLAEVALIGVGAWLVMRIAHMATRRLTSAYSLPVKVASLFLRAVASVVYGCALLWALARLGVSGSVLWGAFTGFATVGAVAFFAAWSVLSNIFCTFLIFTTRPFRLGDQIELLENGEKPGLKGVVTDINLIYTTLHEVGGPVEGTLMQIPNSLFFQRGLRRWRGGDSTPGTLQGDG